METSTIRPRDSRDAIRHGAMLDCGHVLSVPERTRTTGTGATGYACTRDGRTMCYECAAEESRKLIRAGSTVDAYYTFPNEQQTWNRLSRDTFYPSNTGAKVTTWPGIELGVIVSARVFGHNFGGRVVSMRVRMFDGTTWHGRASWDNGSCITLRKVKE